jgi:hypothetical protein
MAANAVRYAIGASTLAASSSASFAAIRVAIGAFTSVDESTMSVAAIRVPLIQILIEDFGVMTVATKVVLRGSVVMAAESGMTINGQRRQSTPINFTCQTWQIAA